MGSVPHSYRAENVSYQIQGPSSKYVQLLRRVSLFRKQVLQRLSHGRKYLNVTAIE